MILARPTDNVHPSLLSIILFDLAQRNESPFLEITNSLLEGAGKWHSRSLESPSPSYVLPLNQRHPIVQFFGHTLWPCSTRHPILLRFEYFSISEIPLLFSTLRMFPPQHGGSVNFQVSARTVANFFAAAGAESPEGVGQTSLLAQVYGVSVPLCFADARQMLKQSSPTTGEFGEHIRREHHNAKKGSIPHVEKNKTCYQPTSVRPGCCSPSSSYRVCFFTFCQ